MMNVGQFIDQGFAAIPGLISGAECEELAARAGAAAPGSPGTRCLLSFSWCQSLAGRLKRHPRVAKLLPADCVAAQCTYFEKSIGRNWLVPIHQDLCIPVAGRVTDQGLSGWAEKEGMLFVRPPITVLESLVAVRLHLDLGPRSLPLGLRWRLAV